MKVAIIDYGMGNIFSLQNALRKVGIESDLVSQPELVEEAQHVILPGVGAAELAASRLSSRNLDVALARRTRLNRPTTGICLGMQLFANTSSEGGDVDCLGLIPGSVTHISKSLSDSKAKAPSIGWYPTQFEESLIGENMSWLSRYQGQHFYYVHSYQFKTLSASNSIANYQYGGSKITGMVAKGCCVAVQFHPEKSGEIGLDFLTDLIKKPR